jgi:hypothetical protein
MRTDEAYIQEYLKLLRLHSEQRTRQIAKAMEDREMLGLQQKEEIDAITDPMTFARHSFLIRRHLADLRHFKLTIEDDRVKLVKRQNDEMQRFYNFWGRPEE